MGKPKKESFKNKDVLSGGLGENVLFIQYVYSGAQLVFLM